MYKRQTAAIPAEAKRKGRPVYWEEDKRLAETAIWDGTRLKPGNTVMGPCVVETPDTSVVVRPGQRLRLDAFGNFEILLAGGTA